MCEFPNCGTFLCPSDLFERQDSDDLILCDFGGDGHDINFPWKGGFPWYHEQEIHEKKYPLHDELFKTMIREMSTDSRMCFANMLSSTMIASMLSLTTATLRVATMLMITFIHLLITTTMGDSRRMTT
jgi:hypothetical protein